MKCRVTWYTKKLFRKDKRHTKSFYRSFIQQFSASTLRYRKVKSSSQSHKAGPLTLALMLAVPSNLPKTLVPPCLSSVIQSTALSIPSPSHPSLCQHNFRDDIMCRETTIKYLQKCDISTSLHCHWSALITELHLWWFGLDFLFNWILFNSYNCHFISCVCNPVLLRQTGFNHSCIQKKKNCIEHLVLKCPKAESVCFSYGI